MENKIIKRNGDLADYNPEKIKIAIEKANKALAERGVSETGISFIYENTKKEVETILKDRNTSVEEINDIVEKMMMKCDCYELMKEFIEYRYKHKLLRESNTTDKTIFELINGSSEYWNTENSNKNPKVVTTQRDYIAGITSTDIARRLMLPKKIVEAHDEGIIHFHDIDYFAEDTRNNCCLVNLNDMLQNGTTLNGVHIEKPHRFVTACTIATQIINAVSSSQYGGVSVTLTHLAPFVRNSFYRSFKFYVVEMQEQDLPEGLTEDSRLEDPLYTSNTEAYKYARKQLAKEIADGVQTFNYQVNSMASANGQAPFISVTMYLNETEEYKEELAMMIEEFLHQRIRGMQNKLGVWVTPAFPKLIYVLEEDNIKKDSRFWYLTELAAKRTAKRMVPDYVSEKVMKASKINKFGQGDCYGPMGCRSFLTPDRIQGNPANAKDYKGNVGKYYGRFNGGVVTINLFDIALSSKGDFDEFWRLFEERTELCHEALQCRLKRLENATSDVAPILWQDGAFARLQPGESLKKLIHGGYSTISLGYAALYECVQYMKHVSHTTPEGREFGLEVMQRLNDKCAQWKAAEDIDYSLYGTPLESTTYKFAKAEKRRFGDDVFEKLDGHDRLYVTNSYHVPVFEEIDPFEKLAKEAEFQKLSPGGAISYIETCDLSHNIEAVLEVMKFIYDNIMYAELNTKSDYCQVCGYDGEIEIVDEDGVFSWRCPNCGNTDQKKMNVARRTCGYIGTQFWNQGRTNELADRFVHMDNYDECK